MSGYLRKVTAIRNNDKVTKGVSFEILKTSTNAKPGQKEIAEALTNKYNSNIHDSHCGSGNFEFLQLNK